MSIKRPHWTLSDEGMTIIFVTHDPRMAELAEPVIELRDDRRMGS